MEKIKDLLPIIASVLTATLGAAGVLLQEWRQQRDERHRRSQARAEAAEMVEFVERWLKTQQLACSPEDFERAKQTARVQLERIYASLLVKHEPKRHVEERSFVQRALLLYKPQSTGAWVLHFAFYALGSLILLIQVLLSMGALMEVQAHPEMLRENVIILIFFYLFSLAPVLGIRAWAAAVDRRRLTHQTDGAHAPIASPAPV